MITTTGFDPFGVLRHSVYPVLGPIGVLIRLKDDAISVAIIP